MYDLTILDLAKADSDAHKVLLLRWQYELVRDSDANARLRGKV